MKQSQSENNQTIIDLSEFPYGDFQQWRLEVEKLLKGADYEKKMLTKTYDGIYIKPIYTSADVEHVPFIDTFPLEMPFQRGWHIKKFQHSQPIIVKKIHSIKILENEKHLKSFIDQGYSAIEIPVDYSFQQVDELIRIIEANQEVSFYLRFHHSPIPLIQQLNSVKSSPKFQDKVSIFYDPITDMISHGKVVKSREDLFTHIRQLFKETEGLSFPCICVNGACYQNAGATISQEIAIVLALALEYLRSFEQSEISLQSALRKIHFSFGIGSQFFMEIAKLRAFRMLWSHLMNSIETEFPFDQPLIHTESTQTNLTLYDPYVNLLRTTTETLSAILGGADSIWVAPFDYGYQSPNDFSERIAKNIPLILSKEAHIEEVVDPAGGSYAIEALTNEIAPKSYEIFQQIESEGGILSFTDRNLLQQMIQKTVDIKSKDTMSRKNILIGSNLFANGMEHEPKQRIMNAADIQLTVEAVDCEKLHPFYEVSEFETLRTNILIQRMNGVRVTCMILSIGNVLKFIPRIDFTISFIETGGFDVKRIQVDDQIELILNKIEQEFENTIILCSTDEWYQQNLIMIAKAIKNKYQDLFLLIAGLPTDPSIQEEYKQAGIDGFIHIRANVVETLKLIAQKYGVSND